MNMDTITSVEFVYKSDIYYALIRTKNRGDKKHHFITIMNGNLERLLYGNHIVIEEDGVLQSERPVNDEEIARLKQCVMEAFKLQTCTNNVESAAKIN
jgi:hypothetical protein